MNTRNFIVRCCACHRVKTKTGSRWLDLYNVKDDESITYSHGYCPECLEKVMNEIETEPIISSLRFVS